jgi:hypothetical protein
MTQFGPASAVIHLGCDCRYSTSMTLPLGRIREAGEYRVENGRILFSRSKGETAWPYALAEGRLQLTESADETHMYVLVEPLQCR